MADPSTTPTPPTVTLGGNAATLVEPPAIFAMTGPRKRQGEDPDPSAVLAHGAAALRMCWPPKISWPVRPRPAEWYPGVDVLRYGGEIYSALRAGTRGSVMLHDLHDVLHEAAAWVYRSSMTEAEIEEAGRFLASEEGVTETPSESAASTDSGPDGGTG